MTFCIATSASVHAKLRQAFLQRKLSPAQRAPGDMKLLAAVLATAAISVATAAPPRWHELDGYSFADYVKVSRAEAAGKATTCQVHCTFAIHRTACATHACYPTGL